MENKEIQETKKTLFYNQLIHYFIPRIEAMAELEKIHLHLLIDLDAPSCFINKSQETYFHLISKIKEYKEYAEQYRTINQYGI